MYIQSDVLASGSEYAFRLTAHPADNEASSASIDVKVLALAQDIVAGIAGGDRQMTVADNLVLDASNSKDPAGQSMNYYLSFYDVDKE
jgi:hypothetical protein